MVAFSREEAERVLAKGFPECSPAKLFEESFLESCKPMRANGVRARRALDEYGSSGSAFLKELKGEGAEDDVVVIESLQSWMMLVNSLSLCSRLLVAIGSPNDTSLEELGLSRMVSKRLRGERLYGLPFKYNTFFAGGLWRGNWRDKDPLLYSLTAEHSEQGNVPGFPVDVYVPDERCDSVFITTRPIAASGKGAAFAIYTHTDEEWRRNAAAQLGEILAPDDDSARCRNCRLWTASPADATQGACWAEGGSRVPVATATAACATGRFAIRPRR